MCKVLIITGIEDSKLAVEFMKASAKPMSVGNSDGIGYSAITRDNKLFMEKWHDNFRFMGDYGIITPQVIEQINPHIEALKPFYKIPESKINFGSYGNNDLDNITTVTMHTRFATCGKEFENTHPFVYNDTSLIHNGVIYNAHTLNLNKISTCDSENALQVYLEENVATQSSHDLTKLQTQKFLDRLKGYWAFGILAKNIEGKYHLDVVKDGATLYYAFIPALGKNCMVFSTAKDTLTIASKAIGAELTDADIKPVRDHELYRFDAITGERTLDLALEESTLNKVTWKSTYGYGSYKGYDAYDSYNDYGKSKTKKSKQSTNYDDLLAFDSFYDTELSIQSRIVDYDALMGSNYEESFLTLLPATKKFIQEKEEDGYINFEDIIKMLDAYRKDGVQGLYKRYHELKFVPQVG